MAARSADASVFFAAYAYVDVVSTTTSTEGGSTIRAQRYRGLRCVPLLNNEKQQAPGVDCFGSGKRQRWGMRDPGEGEVGGGNSAFFCFALSFFFSSS